PLEWDATARAGDSRKKVAAYVQALVPKAKILATMDSLTYLERGGRIGKARALLGSLLNVKPLITVQGGEVVPLGRARSWPQALDRLVEMLERDSNLTRLAV